LVIGGAGGDADESEDELVFSSVAGASVTEEISLSGLRMTQPLKAVGSGGARTLQLPAISADGSGPVIPPPPIAAGPTKTMKMPAIGAPASEEITSSAPLISSAPASFSSTPSAQPVAPMGGGVKIRAQSTPSLQVLDMWGRPLFDFPIQAPRVMIGREQSDLPMTQDPHVSRWHASLSWRAGSLEIEDIGSTNGVFLRIADEFLLEDGDEFVLGMHKFVFLSTSEPLKYEPEREAGGVRIAGAPCAPSFARLLHIMEGGVIAGLYPLGERFHVGSQQGELVCVDDPGMSAIHAVVERRQRAYYLRDLGSAQGSYIRINSPVELLDGDSFLVGRTRVFVRIP
jgi:pSer/pThr/pTyr-binding forkhead associated (FHA) protein